MNNLKRFYLKPDSISLNLKNLYNCWSCDRLLSVEERRKFFCPCEKQVILPPADKPKGPNYFEMFNLESKFKIDDKKLTNEFLQLIRRLHPDLFTQKSEKEKEYSAKQSRLINKGYRVLQSSISRALYLLELNGVHLNQESTETGDAEDIENAEKQKILMLILELNEQLDEIDSKEKLELLQKSLDVLISPLEKQIEDAFNRNDLKLALKLVSKMKYFQNVDERLKDLKLQFDLNN